MTQEVKKFNLFRQTQVTCFWISHTGSYDCVCCVPTWPCVSSYSVCKLWNLHFPPSTPQEVPGNCYAVSNYLVNLKKMLLTNTRKHQRVAQFIINAHVAKVQEHFVNNEKWKSCMSCTGAPPAVPLRKVHAVNNTSFHTCCVYVTISLGLPVIWRYVLQMLNSNSHISNFYM